MPHHAQELTFSPPQGAHDRLPVQVGCCFCGVVFRLVVFCFVCVFCYFVVCVVC